MVAGLGFLEQKDLEFLLRGNPDTVPILLTLDLVKEKFTKLRSEAMRRPCDLHRSTGGVIKQAPKVMWIPAYSGPGIS